MRPIFCPFFQGILPFNLLLSEDIFIDPPLILPPGGLLVLHTAHTLSIHYLYTIHTLSIQCLILKKLLHLLKPNQPIAPQDTAFQIARLVSRYINNIPSRRCPKSTRAQSICPLFIRNTGIVFSSPCIGNKTRTCPLSIYKTSIPSPRIV